MALILVVFTLQNPYPVQVKFMGWQTGQVPIIVVIIISVLVGAIISLMLGLKQTGELKRYIRRLEEENKELKTPPVTSEE